MDQGPLRRKRKPEVGTPVEVAVAAVVEGQIPVGALATHRLPNFGDDDGRAFFPHAPSLAEVVVVKRESEGRKKGKKMIL